MKKEQQDLAWSVLPKKFKEEVKKMYKEAENGWIVEETLERIFGEHNLTSDAEPEEMLMVPKDQVIELYVEQRMFRDDRSEGQWQDYEVRDIILRVLRELFGSKCLPDEPNPEPKPAKLKFRKGDKVIYKWTGKVKIITYIGDDGRYLTTTLDGQSPIWIKESDLEPYTEPDTSHETPVCENHSDDTSQKEVKMNSNRNLSQNIADCNKQFDNILKDGFRNERRLNIAAMAMRGILSNPQLLKITIETYQEEIGCPDIFVAVAKAAKAQADALLAKCEEGGNHEKA